jgi:methylmalonyl-CoA/ethylmalonyl-CoA epimerase
MKKTASLFRKVNHIGMVVRDLSGALDAYCRGFGVEVGKVVGIEDVGLKVGTLSIGGTEIELLEYQNPDHPLVKPLRGDRLGVNHICYEVENFAEAMETLRQAGFDLVEGFPRKGVHGKIAFFAPPGSAEERIEILEVE